MIRGLIVYRCFEGIKASICSKDKISLSRVHCGKFANKRKANARESVERRKREIRVVGETSGTFVLFFSDTFPRYNPVASFLVHLSSRRTPHPVPTMFYLAGTYIFRPAEIRRLSRRKCLERTSKSGREERKKERDRKKNGGNKTEGLISLNNDGVRAVVTRVRRYTVDSLYFLDRNEIVNRQSWNWCSQEPQNQIIHACSISLWWGRLL